MAAEPDNKYSQKYTPELINELCNELLEFAVEDKTVNFVEFARRKKKTQSWLNRMAEDYSDFEDAYTSAKELLATKLVKTSLYGDDKYPNFNGTHAMNWMRVYSKTYQDYEKWKAEINKVSQPQSQNQGTVNKILEQELKVES